MFIPKYKSTSKKQNTSQKFDIQKYKKLSVKDHLFDLLRDGLNDDIQTFMNFNYEWESLVKTEDYEEFILLRYNSKMGYFPTIISFLDIIDKDKMVPSIIKDLNLTSSNHITEIEINEELEQTYTRLVVTFKDCVLLYQRKTKFTLYINQIMESIKKDLTLKKCLN